jgi:anti-sigma regulatory factor (Ser/Thr protein kinase)
MVPAYDNGGGIAVLVRSLEIAATPDAAASARRWLDGIAPLRALGQVGFDVRLLATELVSNSVRHAGLDASEEIELRLDLTTTRLRMEVRDSGTGFDPTLRERDSSSEGGRGLLIVAAIAHRWGLETADGSLVWFEIDLDRSTGLPYPSDADHHGSTSAR